MRKSEKILIGTEGEGSIGEFLGISKPTVLKYVKIGMPVLILNNKLHAHSENIENWFKAITRKPSPKSSSIEE